MGLIRYVVKRTLQTIPMVFCVIILMFCMIHLAPGNPIHLLIGEFASAEDIRMMEEHFGLNRPIYEQLFIYIYNVIQGDLGYSYFERRPVLTMILERIPATLLLMGTQFVLSVLIGIALGVFSSRRPNSLSDHLITVGSSIGYCLPVFWIGQILIMFFALYLGWFPSAGMFSLREELTGMAYYLDILRHLFIPSLTLTIFNFALFTRLTRTNMLEELQKNYITLARSKGVAEKTVVWKHAFRNALLPTVTVIGLSLGSLLAGAVLTEIVFGWPGIGNLTYISIMRRDYPVIMGILIVVSIAVMIANLVTDILYAVFEPRIRYSS